jgi:choice-of-anchor B domain-containing protein
MAGIYPCHNVDMLAHLSLTDLGAITSTVTASDHWGWTDSESGRDFVLQSLSTGFVFVEITDPAQPVVVGTLPNHVPGQTSVWRDVKVYENVAYIVADVPSTNGLQIFDLTQLTAVTNPPVTFTETAHYDGFGSGHNLWVNHESAYLYVIRTSACPTITIFNLADPLNPVPDGPDDDGVPGCFVDDPVNKLASDTECVIYDGPDADYTGREICFTGSDDTMSIADVTDKANPVVLHSALTYPGLGRAHQGAITGDGRYWLMSDMMDEMMNGHNTRTHVWDVSDLDAPVYMGPMVHDTAVTDHNLYIIEPFIYQTNWRAGLRVLDANQIPNLQVRELAYFDTDPTSNDVAMTGAWSNYPWWGDQVVTVSDNRQGLFVLRVRPYQTFLPLHTNLTAP